MQIYSLVPSSLNSDLIFAQMTFTEWQQLSTLPFKKGSKITVIDYNDIEGNNVDFEKISDTDNDTGIGWRQKISGVSEETFTQALTSLSNSINNDIDERFQLLNDGELNTIYSRLVVVENDLDFVENNISQQNMLVAADIVTNFQQYLSYKPTFQGVTQSWFARNARVGRTVSTAKCKTGDAVLGIDLTNPSNGEGGDQLIYTTTGTQPDVNKPTPGGIKGSNVVYYEQDGGFVRILNVLNSQLGMRTPINPTKAAPFEYMHTIRLIKGIVTYESITSGTFGLKYLGGTSWQIYSSLSGSDNFTAITWDASPFLDKIIILHFNFTSATTLEFRISHPSVGNYYQGNANWNVTFPVSKALQNIVIGTSSHPIVADHFAGLLKSSGSFTTTERNANITELYKMYPVDKASARPYFAPTFTYGSNLFTLNLNQVENAFGTVSLNDLEVRWWKYPKGGPLGNPIDDRILIQHYRYGQLMFTDAGGVSALQYNRLAGGLPTDGTKPDVVCDVTYRYGVNQPFVTVPFGSYY